MEIKLDCLPCIFRQVLESARMATDDKKLIREIMNDYARMVPEIEDSTMAPIIAGKMQKLIKEKTGVVDPYQKFKEKNMLTAKKFLPLVKKEIDKSADSVFAALVMSAMGNSIDAGVSLNVDIEKNIELALKNGFVKSDYNKFKKELAKADDLLIIADNAGEAVFDKILLKELNSCDLKITYAVREIPILNDISKKEVKDLGLDKYAQVISSGSTAPGMVMEEASPEFEKSYKNSDIIISKGQGNLEGLSDVSEEIYYLLKAKCSLVADLLGVEVGDFVFMLK
ncbi:MAG: damage-control phosphatase ARMT1 family protein [Bacillota bacterium]